MRPFALIFALFFLSTAVFADEPLRRKKVSGTFEDVKEVLILAIENRGLVVNYTSHISEMLGRTGADIGASKKIFEQAEIIEFCSAGLSRQMMEMDPHNIVMCPFAVSIYTLPNEKNTVWLSYRTPFGKAARLVGDLLDGVVNEATK